MQALQNDSMIILWLFSFRGIQATVQWHTFKTMFVFINCSSSQNFFFVKYLISIDLLWLSETRYKSKTFTWPDMSLYARYVALMCQTKESNKRAPGRVVVYIKVHLVLIYTLAFSNVLLVLTLNVMVHKSSKCKCSLAWCQVRTFLLFTIWTHPLQTRKYLPRYAGTDRIKKSHYNTYWFTNQVSYNMATVILNNKRNFNGFLAGLARWFQPHPIQQRLKIHPLKFLSWCDFALQILQNIKELLIKSCSHGLRK